MVCIYCGAPTHVTNSRLQKQSNAIWRRRSCGTCEALFTTHEQAALDGGFMVATSQKDKQPFRRDKLFISVYESCKHSQSALEDADGLTDTIIQKLLRTAITGIIERRTIIETTQEVLERFDKTASTVYTAYHSR